MNEFPVRRLLLAAIVVVFLVALPSVSAADPVSPMADLSSLESVSAVPLAVTWDASTGGPAFIAGQFPSGVAGPALETDPLRAAQRFLSRHRTAFRMADPWREVSLMRWEVDPLGMTHVRLQQVHLGVPVLGAELLVHFEAGGMWVSAVNGDFLAGLELETVKPRVQSATALRIAQDALPGADVRRRPQLVVVDGRLVPEVTGTHLAWQVELYDESLPARNVYLIDAGSGVILRSYSNLATGRNRQTYTANHAQNLPGTLWLTEAGPVAGQTPDADGLNAHEFAGATYDYFFANFQRDSYDAQGATLVSTVHYGTNYQNAFWNGSQMVYGDGFASANDVVAHELTHAVTEHTANLVYAFQSGALNESFSDIFGAMVDDGDWLMGEDLPIGAIRSLSSPPAFDDPEHVGQYVVTCQDNGGVHTNSGIPNKAAYLLSEALDRTAAGRVFYRALAYYLTSSSEFNDARAAAIQAAQDLYGAGSNEVGQTTAAFTAVGLDGVNTPPPPSCDCSASLVLGDPSLFSDIRFSVRAAITLYRTRDHLMSRTPAGQHYVDLYYAHTGEISRLLAGDPLLRARAARLLRAILPGLEALLDGQGKPVVISPAMIDELQALLDGLSAADTDGSLAETIAAERARLRLERLAGLTFDQAWLQISTAQPAGFAR